MTWLFRRPGDRPSWSPAQDDVQGCCDGRQCSSTFILAQVLNDTSASHKKQRRQKAASSLALAQGEADRAVQTLENVTATLGATAIQLRNGTGSSEPKAARSGAGAQPQQQQQQQQQEQRQKQQMADTGEDQKSSGERFGGGSSHVVRLDQGLKGDQASNAAVAQEKPQQQQQQQEQVGDVRGTGDHGGRDDVAEALEKVASTANETLTAMKQSKAALEMAAAEAATSGRGKTKVC
jgi:hypothetical protein